MKHRNDRKEIRRREAAERQKFYDSLTTIQKLHHIDFSGRRGVSEKEHAKLNRKLERGE